MQQRTGIGLAFATACSVLIAGCGALPADRPEYAVDVERSVGSDAATDRTPPPLSRPNADFNWVECTDLTITTYELPRIESDAVIECASIPVLADPTGSFSEPLVLGLTRARFLHTPEHAAPLVLTTGTTQPSSRAVAQLAINESPLLSSRPVVAVDRRGTGASTPVSCFTRAMEEQHVDLTRGIATEADRATEAAAIGRESTLACTDQIEPMTTMFTMDNAAQDLEMLRSRWDIDTLAILGVGEGALVALRYANSHPENVSRLVIDSPPALPDTPPRTPGTDALANAAQQSEGFEAAVAAFDAYCNAAECGLGDSAAQTVRSLLADARAGLLGLVTPGAIVTTISGILSDASEPSDQRMATLADVLSATQNRDYAPLLQLSYSLHRITSNDGQFIGRCSDLSTRSTIEAVRNVAEQWRIDYPTVGDELLVRSLLCSAWPNIEVPETDGDITSPTMLIEGTRDPLMGSGTIRELRGPLLATGATVANVTWQGIGHGATLHSHCASQRAADFVTDGEASAATTCPE
ncbi:alpha/beta hydrolase [Hoyosella rhizosphaerae]|uniref:Protease n=1 Tax=Hoyosella rhizosphaerae TaxID=1755582 RepID=A0A916U5E1_9ACTN|nr:alpha/beta hydrolase [Hoyosella rhizosphaerae]MBN4926400.1 alpha/beta hydrolase [Hoyosella rhizosphaerae]GGC59686.1 protease [Hoyosella rhizosphaerae]